MKRILTAKNILPVIVYLLGTISLFVFDGYITRYLDIHTTKDWASLKSTMMIIGPLLLLGSNNLIIRYSEKKEEILVFSLVLVFFLSCILQLGVCLIGFDNAIIPISGFYALALLQSSYLRADLEIAPAQIAQNLWKILLLISILVLVFLNYKRVNISLLVGLCLLSSTLLYFIYIYSKSADKSTFNKLNLPTREESGFSLKFMLSGLTVACSVYLEVSILAYVVNASETTIYYKHYLIFTAVSVFFSGYVGFVLTPIIKNNIEKWKVIVNRKIYIHVYLALTLICVSTVFLWYFYNWFYGEVPSVELTLIFSISSILRIIYIFPTAYMGAAARSNDLNGFILSGIFGIVLLIVSYFVLRFFHFNILLCIAISSLINWIFRVIMAYKYSRLIYINNL